MNKHLRYQFPKKSFKSNCPQCNYRKVLSRYLDTKTGELVPEPYGWCDRKDKCGYQLSPYQKTESGLSYSDEMYEQWKRNYPFPVRKVSDLKISPKRESSVTYTIPDEIFSQSLNHYKRNQFAQLLEQQFGQSVANELLQLFQIGTSSCWPGACVFWYIDEYNRKRGGQIKLFGHNWHTEKYIDREGKQRSKISWVHSALKLRLKKEKNSIPDWLTEYEEKAECSPCLFGLPQLLTAPLNKPIAIVEAPKTAVICTHYLPSFVWLSIGSKSYLNAERLAPIRGRKIMLYPDLNAFVDWSQRTKQLKSNGFQIEVSDYLEHNASEKQKKAGLDLADYLLQQPPTVSKLDEQLARSGIILKPRESEVERLIVEPYNTYPIEWG